MTSKSGQRVKRYREKMKDQGFASLLVWVKPVQRIELQMVAKHYREHGRANIIINFPFILVPRRIDLYICKILLLPSVITELDSD